MARAVAGAASGRAFAEPETLEASGTVGASGVDEWSVAALGFAGGVTASVRTGVRLAEAETVTVYGSSGYIHLNDPWTIHSDTELVLRSVVGAERLFTFPAIATSTGPMRSRQTPWPTPWRRRRSRRSCRWMTHWALQEFSIAGEQRSG